MTNSPRGTILETELFAEFSALLSNWHHIRNVVSVEVREQQTDASQALLQ